MLRPFGFAWIILFMKHGSISTSCSDTGITTAMQFNITCDNHLTVYVDGKLLGEGTTNVENKGFHQYQLTAGSHMIALKCRLNSQPWEGGILGSLENGVVTDTSWKCTNSLLQGWNMRSYEDEDWPIAKSYGPNSASTFPWGEIKSIDKRAVWIWTDDNDNDFVVYCRRSILIPCTKVKSNFFQAMESGKDIAIAGYLLRQTKVASETECGLRCAQQKTCASFTVQQRGGSGPRLCELNTVSAEKNPESVIQRRGFQYYERRHVFY